MERNQDIDRRFARVLVWGTIAASFIYLACYAWLRIVPIDEFLSVRIGPPVWAGHDFIAFLGAARLIDAGAMVATYEMSEIMVAYQSVLGDRAPRIPWPYPPVTGLFIQPLAWVSPVAALAIFYAVLVAAALAMARLVSGRWTIAVLALAFPCTVLALISGQNGTLTALLLAIGLVCWRERPVLAGVALGLLAYKPQFVMLPALLALLLGERQVLIAIIATGAALVLASIAAYGLEPWLVWPHAAARQFEHFAAGSFHLARVVTVYALVYDLTERAWLGLSAHALAAAPALLAICAVWRRSDDLFLRAVTLAAGSVFVSPYALDYDLAVLAIPLAALLGRAPRDLGLSLVEFRWFALLAVGPQTANAICMATDRQAAVLVVAAALIAAARAAGVGLALTPRVAAA